MEVGGSRAPHAAPGDRPIAETFVDRLQTRLAERFGAGTFRLRFDKVALRFGTQLQDALREVVPGGSTVLVTITAPLRQASKTANELVDTLCVVGATKTDLHATLYDNSIVVRVASGSAGKNNVIVLVHNPHPNAAALLDVAQSLLAMRS